MIEHKELGLKIAENPEEKFWIEMKDKCTKAIESNHREIIINEEIVKLAEKKIVEVKNGK